MSEAQAKAPLTKEEKLARLDTQIKNLQQKRDDVANDRVTVRAKKEVYVPNKGDTVLATVGRNSATTQAKIVEGVVVAVKFPEANAEGKVVGGIQVRVRIYEGTMEEQLVTLYPSQLQAKPAAEGEAAAE